MSKYVKDLQSRELKRQFDGVRELIVVNVVGMNATQDHGLRQDLRKKGIQLRAVKNSLARRVLNELGLKGLDPILEGPSAIAWGGPGIVELAKEIITWSKKVEKLQVKGAFVSGTALDSAGVEQLSKLPSRVELLGRVVQLIQSPGARLAALALAPGGRLASQLKTMAEQAESAGETAPAASG